MSSQRVTTVGVIFGGRSVEHDVSVVTGHQVLQAFDRQRYDVVPLYIDRDGRWYSGEPLFDLKTFQGDVSAVKGIVPVVLSPSVQHHGLIVDPVPSGLFARSRVRRLDVVFPTLHGSHGEDGTLQGLLELADVPYVGCGVLASAVANDKLLAKSVLRQHGIPVLDDVGFTRAEWDADPDAVIARIVDTLGYPVFVKPVTLGSSIGIAKASDEKMLRASIDVAANLDRRLMVERALNGAVEINCALLGNAALGMVQTSVLEQPLSWDQFLTYEEKYLRGGEGMKSAERIVPAPIEDDVAATIRRYAVEAFRAIDGRGTARIDFLISPETGDIYLNEINTLPGSLAFYLWHEDGMTARDVVERLVALAREAHADKRRNTYNYQTALIGVTAARGLKGAKGAKRPRADQP